MTGIEPKSAFFAQVKKASEELKRLLELKKDQPMSLREFCKDADTASQAAGLPVMEGIVDSNARTLEQTKLWQSSPAGIIAALYLMEMDEPIPYEQMPSAMEMIEGLWSRQNQ